MIDLYLAAQDAYPFLKLAQAQKSCRLTGSFAPPLESGILDFYAYFTAGVGKECIIHKGDFVLCDKDEDVIDVYVCKSEGWFQLVISHNFSEYFKELPDDAILDISGGTVLNGFGSVGKDILEYGELTVPYGVQTIAEKAFFDCPSIDSITFPKTLTAIKDQAFCQCNNISKIDLPKSVSYLGRGAFAYCDKLREVQLSIGLVEVPEDGFMGCRSLDWVYVPQGIVTIGKKAFTQTGLTHVRFSNTVEYIEERAFAQCKNLSYITIAPSIQNIAKDAFDGSPALRWINFEGTMDQWSTKEEIFKIIPTKQVNCTNGTIYLD